MYVVGIVNGKDIVLPPNVQVPNVDGAVLAKQLEGLKSIAISVKLTGDVTLEVNAGMTDAAAADDFGETVAKLVGTAKQFIPLFSGQAPKLKPIADEVTKTLTSKVKDAEVSLGLKLSADAIGKAADGGE